MKPTVLIVDDEPDIRDIISDELRDFGWEVEEASNGADAIDQLTKKVFDVVISDIRMPKLDGIQLLRYVRQSPHNHQIFVFISAYADIDLWDAYAIGADGYFGKPFRMEELVAVVERFRKPLAERWVNDISDSGPVSHYFVSDVSEENRISVSLGRGGMFVSSNIPMLRRGQMVAFDLAFLDIKLKGTGKILWARHSATNTLSAGYGIEFRYLEEPCRIKIVQALLQKSVLPYIPRGSVKV